MILVEYDQNNTRFKEIAKRNEKKSKHLVVSKRNGESSINKQAEKNNLHYLGTICLHIVEFSIKRFTM